MAEFLISPWFTFALFSAVIIGVSELLQQRLLNKKENSFSVTQSSFYTFLVQVILLLPILLFLRLDINIFSYLDKKTIYWQLWE